MLFKIAAVALVFFGECLEITGELLASKRAANPDHIATFAQTFLLMVVGGALLIAGYMLGYLHLRNIWIIVAVSLATLAVGEPLLAFLLFQESPTTGALIGLVLGILGILSAFLIP